MWKYTHVCAKNTRGSQVLSTLTMLSAHFKPGFQGRGADVLACQDNPGLRSGAVGQLAMPLPSKVSC